MTQQKLKRSPFQLKYRVSMFLFGLKLGYK